MEAHLKKVRDLLFQRVQFIIPFFQRNYSWKQADWNQIVDDIIDTANHDDKSKIHFFGPIVESNLSSPAGDVNRFQLIDGQQRMTTIVLMLFAIMEIFKEGGQDNLASEIEEDYLINRRDEGDKRFKLVPRLLDREALFALIDSNELDEDCKKSQIHKAYKHIKNRFAKAIQEEAIPAEIIYQILTDRLSLVVITIDSENAYEIFESLNSKGLPLEQSDLIRNYIFMQLPTDEHSNFYHKHWQPFEELFKKTSAYDEVSTTNFYRNFIMKDGKYSSKRDTYTDFKQLFKSDLNTLGEVENLVSLLVEFAKYEISFYRPKEIEDQKLRVLISEIIQLDATTSHPLLLSLFNKHTLKLISDEELYECLGDLCSFLIRRSICGESTRPYGKWFVEATDQLSDDVVSSFKTNLQKRGWPDDGSFIPALIDFNLYKKEKKKAKLFLTKLEESYAHKEIGNLSDASIEHVMPQTVNYKQSEGSWASMLGDDWFNVHTRWLHTLGNLTLTGYNSEMSNSSFCKKKAQLVESKFSLNNEFKDVDNWSSEEIRERGGRLAQKIADFWPAPESDPNNPYIRNEPRKDRFPTEQLREAGFDRIKKELSRDFEKVSDTRYIDKKDSMHLIVPASRPYEEDGHIGSWFGFQLRQLKFANDCKECLIAFCCGSPNRILIFKKEEWIPLLGEMSTSPKLATGEDVRHWHVQIHWKKDSIELSLPKAELKRKDISNHTLEKYIATMTAKIS